MATHISWSWLRSRLHASHAKDPRFSSHLFWNKIPCYFKIRPTYIANPIPLLSNTNLGSGIIHWEKKSSLSYWWYLTKVCIKEIVQGDHEPINIDVAVNPDSAGWAKNPRPCNWNNASLKPDLTMVNEVSSSRGMGFIYSHLL